MVFSTVFLWSCRGGFLSWGGELPQQQFSGKGKAPPWPTFSRPRRGTNEAAADHGGGCHGSGGASKGRGAAPLLAVLFNSQLFSLSHVWAIRRVWHHDPPAAAAVAESQGRWAVSVQRLPLPKKGGSSLNEQSASRLMQLLSPTGVQLPAKGRERGEKCLIMASFNWGSFEQTILRLFRAV